ncbi:MAG: trypsin-like peptidase domain-containing protein [Acidobacteriota bacterium]
MRIRSILHPAVLAVAILGGAAGQAYPRDLQAAVDDARDRVLPALVHIQPVLEVYRAGEKGKVAVTGSGVIFSREGHVLTNNHVVENAQRVICTLADQQEVRADLVGRDPWTDLAVIQLDLDAVEGTIRPAELGSSRDLRAGQFVIAMGSPLGLARSISLGVVSTVERYFPEARDQDGTPTGTFNTWIQTDAAINPGNSGGPLVNLDGEVIGINARAIPVFGENLGFAIPIDLAREVAADLITRGKVERSWIGVSWQHLEAAPGLVRDAGGRGALVASVVAGSPADQAGLRPGDVVVSVKGKELRARYEEQLPALRKWLADLPAGEEVDLVYLRGGEPVQALLTPVSLEDTEELELEVKAWGFTARSVSEEMARQLRMEDRLGVMVTGVKPNSYAFEAGLRPGDLIRRLDDQPVPSLRVFEQRARRLIESRKGQILFEVRRGTVLNWRLLEPIYDGDDAGTGAGR